MYHDLNMKKDRVHLIIPNKKYHVVLIERGDRNKLREEINKFFYWKKPNYIFGAAIVLVVSLYFYLIIKKLILFLL